LGSVSQPSGMDMSGPGPLSAMWLGGSSNRSSLGCVSMRDASPGCDNWAPSPEWARASRGAIGREEGPAVLDDCAPGLKDLIDFILLFDLNLYNPR
jgi:hypothetical protein